MGTMKKAAEPRLFLGCAAKTVGQAAVFMSHWSVLQSLIQAVMWHNTEPRTLGVSYWATGLFFAVLCLPGLIYSLISSVCSTQMNSNFCNKITPYLHWIIRIFPATALTISAVPYLDDNAASRTCILSLGFLFINLYVLLIAWNSIKNNSKSDDANGHKTPGCIIISGDGKMLGFDLRNEFILAVCITMGVRWCCGTINVFYENWYASLPITFLVYIYASAVLISEHSNETKEGCASAIFPRTRSIKSNEKHSPHNDPEQTLSFELNQSTDAEVKSSESDKYSTEMKNEYDEFKWNSIINDTDNKENHQINDNNETLVVSETGVKVGSTHQVCTASYCYAVIYAFVIGPALGALASICIWMFTSPDVLCLWGDVSTKSMGYLIMTSFVVGSIAATVMNLERLCNGEEDGLCADTKEKLKVKKNSIYRMVTRAILCCLVVVGTSLILYTKKSFFLFGSSILCLVLPSSLRMIMYMSYDLVMTCKLLRTPGKISTINAVPGILLFFGGFAFVIFYILGISFVNPQITHYFLGRMDLILLPEIGLVILPLLFGPALKCRVTSTDRLRSSSTGPLLESDAMNSTCNTSDNSFSESHNKKFVYSTNKNQRKRQYTKSIQVLFLIVFLTIVTVVKYVSMRSVPTCDVSISDCDDIETRKEYDLRVMSWNILLGHKMNGRSNLKDIARITDSYNPHVLALQEASGLPAYWGGKDIFGYLQTSTKSCYNKGDIINPLQGSFEVGLLSRVEIIQQSAAILPNGGISKIPNYTMAKISSKIPSKSDTSEETGSGDVFTASPQQQNSTLHIYTIHAVYKNWTCERYSKLSCEQMKFLQDDIRKLPIDDPVIVMGDFNINPSEPELDIWYQGDLGFKSALWPSFADNSKPFSGECINNKKTSIDECDCECRNNSSDPPNSTLLNRRAAVDHIFYRGLRLVGEADILEEVGELSDHYPILADFAFQ